MNTSFATLPRENRSIYPGNREIPCCATDLDLLLGSTRLPVSPPARKLGSLENFVSLFDTKEVVWTFVVVLKSCRPTRLGLGTVLASGLAIVRRLTSW